MSYRPRSHSAPGGNHPRIEPVDLEALLDSDPATVPALFDRRPMSCVDAKADCSGCCDGARRMADGDASRRYGAQRFRTWSSRDSGQPEVLTGPGVREILVVVE